MVAKVVFDVLLCIIIYYLFTSVLCGCYAVAKVVFSVLLCHILVRILGLISVFTCVVLFYNYWLIDWLIDSIFIRTQDLELLLCNFSIIYILFKFRIFSLNIFRFHVNFSSHLSNVVLCFCNVFYIIITIYFYKIVYYYFFFMIYNFLNLAL